MERMLDISSRFTTSLERQMKDLTVATAPRMMQPSMPQESTSPFPSHMSRMPGYPPRPTGEYSYPPPGFMGPPPSTQNK